MRFGAKPFNHGVVGLNPAGLANNYKDLRGHSERSSRGKLLRGNDWGNKARSALCSPFRHRKQRRVRETYGRGRERCKTQVDLIGAIPGVACDGPESFAHFGADAAMSFMALPLSNDALKCRDAERGSGRVATRTTILRVSASGCQTLNSKLDRSFIRRPEASLFSHERHDT
jgi:hypothetical protein